MRTGTGRARIDTGHLVSKRGPFRPAVPRIAAEGGLAEWESAFNDDRNLIVLDLFCGAGGLSQGFLTASNPASSEYRFVIAAGLDHDIYGTDTFGSNFLAKARHAELADIDDAGVRSLVRDQLGLSRVDVVIGGPPCQGFSIAGRAKVLSLSEDKQAHLARRNHLYREFLHFVSALEPTYVVMENVTQMATHRDENGTFVDRIRDDFDRLGYDIGTQTAVGEPLELDAAWFGVPQTRRRLFFVGVRRGRASLVRQPRPTHDRRLIESRTRSRVTTDGLADASASSRQRLRNLMSGPLRRPRTLADAISDLPQLTPPAEDHEIAYQRVDRPDLRNRGLALDEQYLDLMRAGMHGVNKQLIFDHVVRPVRPDDAEAFRHMPEGGTYDDVPADYRRYKFERDRFDDRYFKLPWDQPSRAITAHIAKDGYWYIHPDIHQGRTLSVREAARVQSFPDHFRFSGFRTSMYRQIGNAVPPLLARALALEILDSVEHRSVSEERWIPPVLLGPTQPFLPSMEVQVERTGAIVVG